MLQRTRADIVVPFFEDFQERFSRPEDVLATGGTIVDEIFDAIGLRWRANYFWKMHLELINRFHGEVPDTYEQLCSLPGVGQYAASAVCVFVYGQSRTVIDSNVLRILGRYYGINFPDHARKSDRVRRWASRLAPLDEEECRMWNWGLIDFGSLVCIPENPRCELCPVRESCWFNQSGQAP